MSSVLEGVETNQSHSLFQEIVASQSHCKQVRIPWVPANGRDVLFTLLFVGKPPQRQHVTLALLVF